jgi:hypothetical protein
LLLATCVNAAARRRRSGLHGVPLRAIAFRMTNGFRMHTVSATFAGFPAVRGRW